MNLDDIQKQMEEQDRIIWEAMRKREVLQKELEMACASGNNEKVKSLYGKYYKLVNGKTTHLFFISGSHENPMFVSSNELRLFNSDYKKINLSFGKSDPPLKVFSNEGIFIGPHGGYGQLPLEEISYTEYLKEAAEMLQIFSAVIK